MIMKRQLLLMAKLKFQQLLLQSSMSHDPSEIIQYSDLMLEKPLLFLSMLKTAVHFNIFVKIMIHFFFQDSLINRKLRRTAFI